MLIYVTYSSRNIPLIFAININTHNIYTLIIQLSKSAIIIPFLKHRKSLRTYKTTRLIAIKHATISTCANSLIILVFFNTILNKMHIIVPIIIFRNILHGLMKHSIHRIQKQMFIYAPPTSIEKNITIIGKTALNNIADNITTYFSFDGSIFLSSVLIIHLRTSAPSLL